MIDLNEKVFGNIKAREIFGAMPPATPDTEKLLDGEYNKLLEGLSGMTREELHSIITKQKKLEKEVNSRPGAMALPQSKIKLYVSYNQRYIRTIEEIIKN